METNITRETWRMADLRQIKCKKMAGPPLIVWKTGKNEMTAIFRQIKCKRRRWPGRRRRRSCEKWSNSLTNPQEIRNNGKFSSNQVQKEEMDWPTSPQIVWETIYLSLPKSQEKRDNGKFSLNQDGQVADRVRNFVNSNLQGNVFFSVLKR